MEFIAVCMPPSYHSLHTLSHTPPISVFPTSPESAPSRVSTSEKPPSRSPPSFCVSASTSLDLSFPGLYRAQHKYLLPKVDLENTDPHNLKRLLDGPRLAHQLFLAMPGNLPLNRLSLCSQAQK